MIFCIGAFKTVPHMFYQLYSVHGIIQGYVFPLVYVLATRKNEVFYRTMLQHLKSHAEEIGLQLEPQYVSSDFKYSFINAARTMFPNAILHGCLFHFTQNLWKNAVIKGLNTELNSIPEVNQTIRALLALPFVPVTISDIEEVFDVIVNGVHDAEIEDDVHNKLADLINYVERIYVRGVTACGRRRAVAPKFEPRLWNVYDLVITKQQRLTNAVEGWHSRFQQIIVSYHSGIWKFLENIQKDQMVNTFIGWSHSHKVPG